MAHSPLEKIQALDSIEKEIILCLQSAGQSLLELSKEKSSQKAAENHTQQFLKSLSAIEGKLSDQINYLTQVSTGQPHEGSGYSSACALQMAWHRIHHARSRVRELEESKAKYFQAANRNVQQPRSNGTTSGAPALAAPPSTGSGII
ncbi:Mediator of RNA polymerase II transcription subunit 11 [Pseudolycoriella hygida]|uniref:Mediator of RNA polymerase II transcription subunit 11 n=1 Tax=Pseudolycoriella hygida TaxID=35572 RepID=A0A9Q0ND02_9DIPT|nr:Mediator of RNA polymerase II transcription subunit 11 [Pseudolycoriella hygida]